MGLACLGVQRVASGQDGVILACVTLSWTDVLDAAVTVFVVVPVHEFGCPDSGLVELREALSRELRAVLGGSEQ